SWEELLAAESVRGPSMAEFRTQAQLQLRWANQQQASHRRFQLRRFGAGREDVRSARWPPLASPNQTFSGRREKTWPGWNPLNRFGSGAVGEQPGPGGSRDLLDPGACD